MYGCKSWTKKKTEHGRTDALQLWCRRLESPARRSNQSVLKEISSEYSLEGLMLTLKLQYFSHWIRRADSLEKTLMLEKIEGRRRREWQRMRWWDGITNSVNVSWEALGDGEGLESLVCCSPWGHIESDMTEQLNNNNRDRWGGCQQQCRILEGRAERARDGESGRSQIIKASMVF